MNSSTKWGFLTAIFVTIWLLGGFSLLSSLSLKIPTITLRTLTGALGLVILFVGVLMGIKASKKKAASGFSYGKAFQSGLIVTIIVALIVSLASFLYVKFINPHLADDMVREAEASLKVSGASAKEILDKLNDIKKEFSVSAQVIAPLIVQTVAGGIFSLVLAFFFKSKKVS